MNVLIFSSFKVLKMTRSVGLSIIDCFIIIEFKKAFGLFAVSDEDPYAVNANKRKDSDYCNIWSEFFIYFLFFFIFIFFFLKGKDLPKRLDLWK
jgi:hypothetical protein